MFNESKSDFQHKTAILNYVTIVMFFYILCDGIFIFLFAISQTKKRAFKTNNKLFYQC